MFARNMNFNFKLENSTESIIAGVFASDKKLRAETPADNDVLSPHSISFPVCLRGDDDNFNAQLPIWFVCAREVITSAMSTKLASVVKQLRGTVCFRPLREKGRGP